jgi:hypothetical protein
MGIGRRALAAALMGIGEGFKGTGAELDRQRESAADINKSILISQASGTPNIKDYEYMQKLQPDQQEQFVGMKSSGNMMMDENGNMVKVFKGKGGGKGGRKTHKDGDGGFNPFQAAPVKPWYK